MEHNTRWYNYKLFPNNNNTRHTQPQKRCSKKNDLAVVNETKPRLMHFVACKTVREYKRNQEKIKEFLLTEKKNQKNQLSKKLTDHTPESQFHMDHTPESQFHMEQPGPSRTQESKLQKDQPGPSGSQSPQAAQTKRNGSNETCTQTQQRI